MRSFGLIGAFLVLAAPAMAEVDVTAAASCFGAAADAGTDPSDCIDAAHEACMVDAQERGLVAALCFTNAKDAWSAGLAARLQRVMSESDQQTAALAQVETKYDLLAALLQCDRIEELSLIGSDQTGEMITMQKARCTANASALAYMRLYLRSRSLPLGDNQ